jgi:hypothetical protein
MSEFLSIVQVKAITTNMTSAFGNADEMEKTIAYTHDIIAKLTVADFMKSPLINDLRIISSFDQTKFKKTPRPSVLVCGSGKWNTQKTWFNEWSRWMEIGATPKYSTMESKYKEFGTFKTTSMKTGCGAKCTPNNDIYYRCLQWWAATYFESMCYTAVTTANTKWTEYRDKKCSMDRATGKVMLLKSAVSTHRINVICLQEMQLDTDLDTLTETLSDNGDVWNAVRGGNSGTKQFTAVLWNTSVLGNGKIIDTKITVTPERVCAVRLRGDLIIVSAHADSYGKTTKYTLATLHKMAIANNTDLIVGIDTNNNDDTYENFKSANDANNGFTTAKIRSNINAQPKKGGEYIEETKDRILFYQRRENTFKVATVNVINTNVDSYKKPIKADLKTLLPNDTFPSDHAMVYAMFQNFNSLVL